MNLSEEIARYAKAETQPTENEWALLKARLTTAVKAMCARMMYGDTKGELYFSELGIGSLTAPQVSRYAAEFLLSEGFTSAVPQCWDSEGLMVFSVTWEIPTTEG